MIRYALICSNEHSFDSWFQSAEAFDKLQGAGMVCCSVCAVTDIRKSIMAPRIGKAQAEEAAEDQPPAHPLSAPVSPAQQALRELREKIEATSEDVGNDFASEARKIHNGEAPERAIYGEAKPQDAKDMIEEGLPIAPLPFMPNRKIN